MRKTKNYSFLYILIIGVFGTLIWFIIQKGQALEVEGINTLSIASDPITTEQSAASIFMDELSHNLMHPLSTLILQIIAILFFGKLFGYFFKKIGQPSVIAEIIAGIVLGPSLVGMLFPEFSSFLFPKESLKTLQFLSQIGLIMFMFIIGMELNIKVLKNKAREAVIISHASIVFPYFLGVTLAYFLYEHFAPENISFLAFALFMGIAMSITAFPVLARIIQERGLTKTSLGAMAITCAAADDITAWCILAVVVAIVKAGSVVNALFTISLSIAYVLMMLYAVKPLLKKFGSVYASKENLTKTTIAIMFMVLLFSSYLTEVIGIHALFGAFLAGVIIPENLNLKQKLVGKIEDVCIVLLLPLVFVLTGLRTQIGLLNEGNLWLVCLLIIVMAVAGKFLGSAATAKFVGLSWKDSLSIGALMNTRGLMELIVLNIGYDLGILTPEVFAMMVIMALVTTFMTGPSLDLINYFFRRKRSAEKVEIDKAQKV